jgi:hypothetical protein
MTNSPVRGALTPDTGPNAYRHVMSKVIGHRCRIA